MFTPGPWEVYDGFSDTQIKGMRNGREANIITGMYDEENEPALEELAANAFLIAAAPELLEACKYVVQYHRDHDSGEGELFGLDFVTTCIAAIRKAESEGENE